MEQKKWEVTIKQIDQQTFSVLAFTSDEAVMWARKKWKHNNPIAIMKVETE